MELDELKNSWGALDNRLKKNEALTETLIIKMTENKAKRSIGKLILWGAIGAIIALLIIPFITSSYYKVGGEFIFRDIIFISAIPICCIGFIWETYKVCRLMKIDFSKKISDNIYNINRYIIFLKREKIISIAIGPIYCILLPILAYAEMKVSVYLWMFLVCGLSFGGFLCFWMFKMYKKNTASILESLNEIKDIEEKD